MKKILAVILCMVITFSVLSITVSAADCQIAVYSVAEYDDEETEKTEPEKSESEEPQKPEKTEDEGGTDIFKGIINSIVNLIKDLKSFFQALVDFINNGMPGLPFWVKNN